ncbi:MAG TPA: hypothetical protein VNO14_14925 [Blastocatellia bacterium]|nr:hypothetical protein [Blastocatellia bacterium]
MSTIKQNVIEAFASVPRPDLMLVRPLRWSEEHESDFQWYRQHSWQEFSEELPSGRFDPFEFRSLNPLAYHYFVPGILLATFNSIEVNPDGLHLWEREWIGTLIPSRRCVEEFKRDYLVLFTPQQRQAVVRHLEYYNSWHSEKEGYRDEEIEEAVRKVWWDET